MKIRLLKKNPVIAKEKALSVRLLVPNAETIEAMEAARRGELITIDNMDNLLNGLNKSGNETD